MTRMWLSVALRLGKKPVRGAASSPGASAAQAASRRWFAQPLLYAMAGKGRTAFIGIVSVLSPVRPLGNEFSVYDVDGSSEDPPLSFPPCGFSRSVHRDGAIRVADESLRRLAVKVRRSAIRRLILPCRQQISRTTSGGLTHAGIRRDSMVLGGRMPRRNCGLVPERCPAPRRRQAARGRISA